MTDLVGGNQIARGTKQYLLIEVTDVAGQVTDLSTRSPKYTVKDSTLTDTMYNLVAGLAVDMTLYCLIDTTVGTWNFDHYLLWGQFTIAPEAPLLGPFDFYLI